MTKERLELLKHRSETCDLCSEFAKEGVRELIAEVERLQVLADAGLCHCYECRGGRGHGRSQRDS
jgi:hypothetical protein